MGFEPQKFFIGLMDLFSILLPGALLTYLLRIRVERVPWADARVQRLEGPKGWVAFLVASYLLGHLVFLLGSWLDEFYDWLRGRTLNHQIHRLARESKTFRWWVRGLVWLVFKRERNHAVELAGKIRESSLAKVHGKKSVNNFQWCKALLTLESSESLAVVERLEADSKFFRCFLIVMVVGMGFLLWDHRWKLTIAAAALIPLVLWRYMEQRFKSTNQAYWAVIALTGKQDNITLNTERRIGGPTRAGGVVFRKRWFRSEKYLLVEAKKTAGEWVLPKGKIEPDEDIREAAIREVHEETGVWARIAESGDLGEYSYNVDGARVRVHAFLMQQVARGFRSNRFRKRAWFKLEEAKKLKIYDETRVILDTAAKRIPPTRKWWSRKKSKT